MSHMKLSQLIQNSKVKIQGFVGDPVIVERLKEMGFYPGLEIELVGRAPFGGPLIFRFGNTVLALRNEEAECAITQA